MYISISALQKLNTTWWLLKITSGLFFIAAGADKFINLLTGWQKYISPAVISMFHLSPTIITIIAALVEIALGIALLSSKHTKIGAYLSIGWILIVIANLLSMHQSYDIAARDFMIIVGIFALAQLTTIRERISTEQVI